MRKYTVAFMFLLIHAQLVAQDSTGMDRINGVLCTSLKQRTHRRVLLMSGANGLAYGGTMVVLYDAWYKNYPQSAFHFFNDNKEWLQVDKAGHVWSSYTEGRMSIGMWQWTGIRDNQAIWIGGLSGLAYQSIIELLDGFSSQWGFSWGDYLANIAGSSLLIGQELRWKEQKILLKFSTHLKTYPAGMLRERAVAIYGTSLPERMLKDYNAQSYWLSINIRAFFHQLNIPSWLNIALGYGAEGMFGALHNKWTLADGTVIDRSDIYRYRQFYLAPDLDLSKIKTRSKFLKTAFFVLNSLKFPAPSLELSKGSMKCHWISF